MPGKKVILKSTLIVAFYLGISVSSIVNSSQIARQETKVCPKYVCSDFLYDSNFCQKQDVANPSLIHMKDCGSQFCNADMNQCQNDPYMKMNDKQTGQFCEYSF